MKTFTNKSLLSSLMIIAGILTGANAATTSKTIRNTSGVCGNDFHCITYNGGTSSTITEAFTNGFFIDTIFSTSPLQSFDYGTYDNTACVAPGGGDMKLDLNWTYNTGAIRIDNINSYLTNNGVAITTLSLKISAGFIPNGANSFFLKIVNDDPVQTIRLLNAELWKDNTTNPITAAGWFPTGVPIFTGQTYTLAPLSSLTLGPYSYSSATNYAGFHYNAFMLFNTTPLFEEASSAFQNEQSEAAVANQVPALSTWGLIALSILVLSAGIFFVRKIT